MALAEQMANVGSEVERAISWKEKDNLEYSRQAQDRALELLYLTKGAHRKESTLKEICRVYEMLADYFRGENRFESTSEDWRKYFNSFAYLSAKRRQAAAP